MKKHKNTKWHKFTNINGNIFSLRNEFRLPYLKIIFLNHIVYELMELYTSTRDIFNLTLTT